MGSHAARRIPKRFFQQKKMKPTIWLRSEGTANIGLRLAPTQGFDSPQIKKPAHFAGSHPARRIPKRFFRQKKMKPTIWLRSEGTANIGLRLVPTQGFDSPKAKKKPRVARLGLQPVGESNPCYQDENLAS